ncbi:MAG: DUF6709 family protein [Huintestinicola sp.]
MTIKFSEKKTDKIDNSKIREKDLKYKLDTLRAYEMLRYTLFFVIIGAVVKVIPFGDLDKYFYISIIGAVVTIALALKYFAGTNYNKLKTTCQSASISFDEVERDMEGSLNYCGSTCIVGNKYLIIGENIHSFEKICWMYYYSRFVTNNGAKVKRRSIMIYLDDGSEFECCMNENKAVVFLNEIERKHPEVILGYSSDLEKLFSSDINQFRSNAASMRPQSIYEYKSDETK